VTRPTARRITALTIVAAVGWATVAPAAASPELTSAQEQATQLRRAVDDLQARTERAIEAYNAAGASLGQAVTAHLLADRQLAATRSEAAAGRMAAAARVRALYVAGGQTALYASVLQGESLADVLDRYRRVQAVVAGDHDAVDRADLAVGQAGSVAVHWQQTASSQDQRERAAAAAATQVDRLLATTSTLLATASADVARIAEADRQAALRAAEQAFQARLAAAQQAASQAAREATEQAARTVATAAGAALPVGTLGSAPTSAAGAIALAEARRQIGKPYVWGASGPAAFDCSGLTQAAYASAGIVLPRVAADQWNAGTQVALGALAPGDLLFWASSNTDPTTIHHVAIYAGNGRMVAAPQTGELVQDQAVYLDGYVGAVRPTGS
jgi:cell wall-associated NlpC family hydrolase